MNQARIVCTLTFALVAIQGAGPLAVAEEPAGTNPPAKKLAAEERKLGFERLKKELEAFKPAADAERDEVMVYLQQVFVASTKFATENPKTTEGFEAAAWAARQLFQSQHPKSGELAKLALDLAPPAGIEQRQVAVCWMLVANDHIVKNEFKDARAALDKMKDIAPDLHALALKQLERQEKENTR